MKRDESLLRCVVENRNLVRQTDCVEPAEALAIVANETHLTILDALWQSPDRPLSFSELRKRAGTGNSSRYNYHLGLLTGPFVSKTEVGYDLRPAGKRIVQAIRTGSLTEHPRLESFALEDVCRRCESPLEVSYLDNLLSITCSGCQHIYGHHPFPPAGLNDRSRSEIVEAFNRQVRTHYSLALDGVCPECGGQRRRHVVGRRDRPYLDIQCEQYFEAWRTPVGFALLEAAAVVAFYREHGVDLGRERYWQLEWCTSDELVTILSADPFRIRVYRTS